MSKRINKPPVIAFPKLTREQNNACKLSDEQIAEIPNLLQQGYTKKYVALMYGVSPQAITWWCKTKEERKEITKRRPKVKKEYDPNYFKKYRKRKFEIHPEMKTYENQWDNDFKKEKRPLFKETMRKTNLKYYYNHREEQLKNHKEYRNSMDWPAYGRKEREKLGYYKVHYLKFSTHIINKVEPLKTTENVLEVTCEACKLRIQEQ